MLDALIRWSLRFPRLVVIAAAMFLVYGGIALGHASFDVFPEFVPAQAEVQTEAPGLTAEQVEQLVTRPIEQAVNGAAGVASVRSTSIPGLSLVNVTFNEGADPWRARQIVAESLGEAAASLPAGADVPKVAPLTSSTMDLLKIGFTSDTLDPRQLRDLVQYTVRPRLLSVPGVARATVYGGALHRIEVRVRPGDLVARDLSFGDVVMATRAATGIAGGGVIDTPEQRLLIETHGQADGPADIAAAPIASSGSGVTIGDVADVVDATMPNIGDALIMGKRGALISLSSQYGANTLSTTRAVEAALAELAPAIRAQGVTMTGGLHRPANFVETALANIAEDLAVGAVLIAIVLFLFMRNLRSVLISFVSIPLALLAAVLVLERLGWTVNTMTLGGLAVALGVIVDDAVIDVENIVRRLRGAAPGTSAARTILAAAIEVRAPVIYATFVVAVALLPVLMLHGLQGAFFSPLAAAFILATLASLAVAIVVTPALSLLLLQGAELAPEPPLLLRCKAWHARLLRRTCAAPRLAFAISGAAVLVAALALFLFNAELLPSFKEGHFVVAITGPAGTSLPAMESYGTSISRELLRIPQIGTVEQQLGRAEGGEDNWGPERSEIHIELKPGLSGREQDKAEAGIHEVLDGYPGLQTEVLTFLGDRIGESLVGETASLAINIYGAEPDTLDAVARNVSAVLGKVPGAVDTRIQQPEKTPVLRVDIDQPSLARYGLSSAEVLDAVATAYRGTTAAQIYRSDRAIDIAVTSAEDMRQNPDTVGELLVRSSTGVAIPLSRVARVYFTEGRTEVSHIGGRPVVTVTANPDPESVTTVTAAARAAIAAQVKLPAGVYLDYGGAAEGAASARNELLRNSLLALFAIVALLAVAFRNGRSTALILASAPGALVGGVVAVALTGASLSLGSLVGFVTLFGITARNAILLIAHADHLIRAEGRDWSLETLLVATGERVTPILMTALVTALGLLPLALGTGQAGREIQGPMAIVILGGLVSATIISLVVLPAMIWRFWRPARLPAGEATPAAT